MGLGWLSTQIPSAAEKDQPLSVWNMQGSSFECTSLSCCCGHPTHAERSDRYCIRILQYNDLWLNFVQGRLFANKVFPYVCVFAHRSLVRHVEIFFILRGQSHPDASGQLMSQWRLTFFSVYWKTSISILMSIIWVLWCMLKWAIAAYFNKSNQHL